MGVFRSSVLLAIYFRTACGLGRLGRGEAREEARGEARGTHACGQLWDVGLVLVKPSRCSLRVSIVGSSRVKNLRGQSGVAVEAEGVSVALAMVDTVVETR